MTARSFTASVLALILALPGPAMADDRRDAARARSLALGLTALAAVALAVRAADRDDRDDEGDGEGDGDDRPRLPATCLRSFHEAAGRGPLVLHDPGCLEERAGGVGDLPLGCAVTLRTTAGFETGFDPLCLGREGWATG